MTNTSSSRTLSYLFWLLVGCFCLGWGVTEMWCAYKHHKAQTKRDALVRAIKLAREDLVLEMEAYYSRQDREARLSRSELRERINRGEPFKVVGRHNVDHPDGPIEEIEWYHAASGSVTTLHFRGEQWLSRDTPSRVKPTPPHPKAPPILDDLAEIRRFFAGSFSLGIGTVTFLIAFGLALVWPAARRPATHVMLAMTLICTTMWLFGYNQPFRLRTIFSNDMLLWALLMALVSIPAIILAHRRPTPSYPACPQCEYNLTGNTSGVCPECGTAIPPNQ